METAVLIQQQHNNSLVSVSHSRGYKQIKNNTYKTNKHMHEKHTDQLPLPSDVITTLKGMTQHEEKEHWKTLNFQT